jgi:hypothetical protein
VDEIFLIPDRTEQAQRTRRVFSKKLIRALVTEVDEISLTTEGAESAKRILKLLSLKRSFF